MKKMLSKRSLMIDGREYRIANVAPLDIRECLYCPACAAPEECQSDQGMWVQYGFFSVRKDLYIYLQRCVVCGLRYAWSQELEGE